MSEFDRIFERLFVLYPFRSKSWVESNKRYHNINCVYIIFSQIDAKRGLIWPCWWQNCRILHPQTYSHCNGNVYKRKYFVLDAHFVSFSTVFVSAWTHSWKFLMGPLLLTMIHLMIIVLIACIVLQFAWLKHRNLVNCQCGLWKYEMLTFECWCHGSWYCSIILYERNMYGHVLVFCNLQYMYIYITSSIKDSNHGNWMCSQHLWRVNLDRSLAKIKTKKKNTSLPHEILKNLRMRNNFVYLCSLIFKHQSA